MFGRKETVYWVIGGTVFLLALLMFQHYGVGSNYVTVSPSCDGYGIQYRKEIYFDAKDIATYRVEYGQQPPARVHLHIREPGGIRKLEVILQDDEVLELTQNIDACRKLRKAK